MHLLWSCLGILLVMPPFASAASVRPGPPLPDLPPWIETPPNDCGQAIWNPRWFYVLLECPDVRAELEVAGQPTVVTEDCWMEWGSGDESAGGVTDCGLVEVTRGPVGQESGARVQPYAVLVHGNGGYKRVFVCPAVALFHEGRPVAPTYCVYQEGFVFGPYACSLVLVVELSYAPSQGYSGSIVAGQDTCGVLLVDEQNGYCLATSGSVGTHVDCAAFTLAPRGEAECLTLVTVVEGEEAQTPLACA